MTGPAPEPSLQPGAPNVQRAQVLFGNYRDMLEGLPQDPGPWDQLHPRVRRAWVWVALCLELDARR